MDELTAPQSSSCADHQVDSRHTPRDARAARNEAKAELLAEQFRAKVGYVPQLMLPPPPYPVLEQHLHLSLYLRHRKTPHPGLESTMNKRMSFPDDLGYIQMDGVNINLNQIKITLSGPDIPDINVNIRDLPPPLEEVKPKKRTAPK